MKKITVTCILTEDELSMLDQLVVRENARLAAERTQGHDWAIRCPNYSRKSYLYIAMRMQLMAETREMRQAKQTPEAA